MRMRQRRRQASITRIMCVRAFASLMKCACNVTALRARSAEVGPGLRPEPPDLSEVAGRWNPPQLLWILKHGIIATGMPAFGSTHTQEQLWDLVAFVQKLPRLSPEQYKGLEQGAGAGHEHGTHEHQHGH